MGKIRPTETPRGAIRALFDELRRLHRGAGEPSTRAIARGIGKGTISHATVHATLRGPRVPRWPVLELVVEQLDGDVDRAQELWLAARDAEDRRADQLPSGVPHSFVESAGFSTSMIQVVSSDQDGGLVVRVENGGSVNEVRLNRSDRRAMAALFAGYLQPHPRYDPHPRSYAVAAAKLGWSRTALVKRIEYLRVRLTRAGVPTLEGFNAIYNLAEFAIACRLISKEDIEQLESSEGDAIS